MYLKVEVQVHVKARGGLVTSKHKQLTASCSWKKLLHVRTNVLHSTGYSLLKK